MIHEASLLTLCLALPPRQPVRPLSAPLVLRFPLPSTRAVVPPPVHWPRNLPTTPRNSTDMTPSPPRSHGRLHQLPVRDPTDQLEVPDHQTWQMNLALEQTVPGSRASGILGGDASGKPPMLEGRQSIRGAWEACESAAMACTHMIGCRRVGLCEVFIQSRAVWRR